MSTKPHVREFYDVQQLAIRLDLGRRKVEGLIALKLLSAVDNNPRGARRQWIVTEKSVQRYLNGQTSADNSVSLVVRPVRLSPSRQPRNRPLFSERFKNGSDA